MNDTKQPLEKVSVITTEEIKSILEKYRIGKKPLAKLLGWGETTIIRYMEGDIPTNEYSSKLKSILDDPEYYYELLLKRKDCLTNVAFKKSKKAVLSKIMTSKIYAVAYYIINKCNGDISAGYLQMILYYSQAFYLALYGRELFQDEYTINNEHVPYLKLYDSMKRSGIHTIEVEEEFLEDKERELIDTVYESFSWYGPRMIKTLMDIEKTQLKITKDIYGNKIITKDTLREYFRDILELYHITEEKEISNYIDRRFPEIKDMN